MSERPELKLDIIWSENSNVAAPRLIFVCHRCGNVLFRCRGWDIKAIARTVAIKIGGRCPYCGAEIKGEFDWDEVRYEIKR